MARLLIDSDAFCKLGVSDLLDLSVQFLNVERNDVARLAALPFMLRRGSLPNQFGAESCDSLIPIAQGYRTLPEASPTWLDPLTQIAEIDAGEAQIFAVAAENESLVITGDKRALTAVKNLGEFCAALENRVIVLEALLLALCTTHGDSLVRSKVEPARERDTMIRVCFSHTSLSPQEALRSYLNDSLRAMSPLILWDPDIGDAS